MVKQITYYNEESEEKAWHTFKHEYANVLLHKFARLVREEGTENQRVKKNAAKIAKKAIRKILWKSHTPGERILYADYLVGAVILEIYSRMISDDVFDVFLKKSVDLEKEGENEKRKQF